MCTSIAEGGRRCKTHEAQIAKNKLKKAKELGDAAAIKAAQIEYYSTEEGVERLEDTGKLDLAERFRTLRNQRTETLNAHFGTRHKLMEPRAVRLRKKAPAYNLRGFDKDGIHRDTGTIYDPKGWDQKGHHQDTHSDFGPDGFNVTGNDAEGYGKDGFKNGYDRDGFSKDGRDRAGYNRQGFNRFGYDRQGYDCEGWARNGLHRETNELWDAEGYDRTGTHHITGRDRVTGLTWEEGLQQRDEQRRAQLLTRHNS